MCLDSYSVVHIDPKIPWDMLVTPRLLTPLIDTPDPPNDTPISGPQNRWQLDTQNPTSKRIPRLLSLRHVNLRRVNLSDLLVPLNPSPGGWILVFFFSPYVRMTGTSFTACWLSSVSSGVNVLLFVLLVGVFFYGCLSWHLSPFFTTIW